MNNMIRDYIQTGNVSKLLLLLAVVFFDNAVCQNSSVNIPQTTISNEFIQATLYLPDSEKGYYRATRFDWSGVIASLEYKGHIYFGQWFQEYDPIKHDAIVGPVEEFTPLGFEAVEEDGQFVKIGVGSLLRPDEQEYNRFSLYEIVNHGTWTVNSHKNYVEFIHRLKGDNGYSYIYQKKVSLTEDKPELVLEHQLKNTGTRVIDTSVYNHNFFMIDNEPIGPAIRTIFPFDVHAEGQGFGALAKVVGNEIQYIRQLNEHEQVYSSGLRGFGNTATDYDIRIENRKTGAGVRINGDHPMEKLVFWSSSTTSCPEPYIGLRVQPDETVSWKIIYEFYANKENTIQ